MSESWKATVLVHPDGEREYTPGSEREERELLTGHGYRRKGTPAARRSTPKNTSTGSSSAGAAE